MKMRLKAVIAALLASLVCSLLIWRLWPHSFTDIISADENAIISISCSSTLSGLNDTGTPFTSHFRCHRWKKAPMNSMPFLIL